MFWKADDEAGYSGLLYERRCRCRCRVADGLPRSRVPLLRYRLEILIKCKRKREAGRPVYLLHDPGVANATVQTRMHAPRYSCCAFHPRVSSHRSLRGFVGELVDDQRTEIKLVRFRFNARVLATVCSRWLLPIIMFIYDLHWKIN